MSLPVIVIVTSQRCGHCIQMRGDGSLKPVDSPVTIPSKWNWSENFFLYLLRGGQDKGPAKFRVFEINYNTMSGSMNDIKEISEFTIGPNNKIKRVIYINNNDNLEVVTVIDDKKSFNPSSNVKFNDFVSKNIPSDITNFTYGFPAVYYFSGSSWENSKLGKEPLYGLLAGANVSFNNGKWGFDKNSRPTRVDPVEMSSKIVNGQLSLNPEAVPLNNNNNNSQIVIARAGCAPQNFQILPM